MRYIVRFTNGVWRVLDLQTYLEVATFGRQVDAVEAVAHESRKLSAT